MYVCVFMYALRMYLVSTDKILRFMDTFIIIISDLLLCQHNKHRLWTGIILLNRQLDHKAMCPMPRQ